MTPAARTARACRATAIGLSACAAYAATHHWLYALPGVIGAGVFLAVGDSYHRQDRRIRARHERARRAALSDAQLLAPPRPDARAELHDGCCERWWTSLGYFHDQACPNEQRRTAA